MRKVKALVIAPYEGLAIQIRNEAIKMTDIEIECCVGNLDEGLAEAKQRAKRGYDVLISRGGTATLLRESGFTVIEVAISLYDLLRSIKLAEGSKKKYAIVGFEAIIRNASFLKDVLPSDMDIKVIAIQKAEDADSVMAKLKDEGIEIVVCDQISTMAASRYHINYILINSGSESIASALNEAVIIGKEKAKNEDLNELCENIIKSCPDYFLLFENNKIIEYGDTTRSISQGFMNVLKRKDKDMMDGEKATLEYEDNGMIYTANARKFVINRNEFTTFYIKKMKLPFALENNGIVLHNAHWAEAQYENSFFGATNAAAKEAYEIENFAKRPYPVFIYGERGTGKGNLAQLLYTISPFHIYPLYDIDMAIASNKAVEFILALYNNDPDKKVVLHLKNINKANAGTIKKIIDLNEEIQLSKRAYLIATATLNRNENLSQECVNYIERLQCLTLMTRPLREHRQDIPSLANLYIALLNRINGTDTISIEEDGLKILQSYDWPGNNDQLARILKKINTRCTDQIIVQEIIVEAINEEKLITGNNSEDGFGINISGKTMKDIEREIALAVLKEENGRKSTTAKRLGLSRATLWRMLQQEE